MIFIVNIQVPYVSGCPWKSWPLNFTSSQMLTDF